MENINLFALILWYFIDMCFRLVRRSSKQDIGTAKLI
jgi:hypothetical protein